MFIDTHAHLFLKDNPFDGFDADTIFTDSTDSGVEQIWLAGTNKYDNVKNIKFAKQHPKNVKCWVGFHPEYYQEFDLAWLDQILKSEIQDSKMQDSLPFDKLRVPNDFEGAVNGGSPQVRLGLNERMITKSGLVKRGHVSTILVGIGEVGVDLKWNKKSTTKAQQMVFEDQVSLANKYNLPVCIHSRDAFEQTLEVMQRYKDTKFVWHCFNLNLQETKKVLTEFPNLYLGLNAIVTYKSGEYIWDSIKEVSMSQILIETDSPFLKPRKGIIKSEIQNSKGTSLCLQVDTGGKGGVAEKKLDPIQNSEYQKFFKLKYNTPYGVIPVYNFVAKKLGLGISKLKSQVEKNCIGLVDKNSIKHKPSPK